MLSHLSIRNILLIDTLDLDFSKGLNVLTGETGAGKSILLDSLGFVLGWRGRADLVRQGASQGEVQARFDIEDPHHPALAILQEAEFDIEDREIIMRRVVSADGRKRGFINDRSVSTEMMRQVGDSLVESHGQHDDKGLLDEKSHIQLLDQFGGYDLAPMRLAYRDWHQADKALRAFEKEVESAAREADYIRHAVEELAEISVEVGEVEALDQKRRMMQKGEKLAGELASLLSLLSHENLGQGLSEALRRAQGLANQLEGEADAALEALGSAFDQISEAENEVQRLADALEFDAASLELTEERLFAVRALERKYQRTADELPALLEDYQAQLDRIDNQDASAAQLQDNLNAARQTLDKEAQELHQKRVEAAARLDESVMQELAPLKMERAVFNTEIVTGEIGASGMDQVRFVAQTNPGAPAGSISKIASGGELSRFLLALKVSLHDQEEKTLLFDEIDRGVGGQTANAVGRRLQALARDEQLLIITHSPQVAALGERHFLVEKAQAEDSTQTSVKPLGQEARIHEIARMISGDQVSDEALAASRKLIEAGHV